MPTKKIATLTLQGSRLLIKDAMLGLSEDSESPEYPHVTVTPGEYVVRLEREGDALLGVKVVAAGVKKAWRDEEVGEVAVDHAAVSICDYDALLAAIKADPDAYDEWTETVWEEAVWEKEYGVLEFGGVKVVHVQTGVGDGVFKVYELTQYGVVVGLECEFQTVDDAVAAAGKYVAVQVTIVFESGIAITQNLYRDSDDPLDDASDITESLAWVLNDITDAEGRKGEIRGRNVIAPICPALEKIKKVTFSQDDKVVAVIEEPNLADLTIKKLANRILQQVRKLAGRD